MGLTEVLRSLLVSGEEPHHHGISCGGLGAFCRRSHLDGSPAEFFGRADPALTQDWRRFCSTAFPDKGDEDPPSIPEQKIPPLESLPKEANFATLDKFKQHRKYIEKGMKFNLSYKSPMITGTDMFDLTQFGCFARDSRGASGKRRDGKEWWVHPAFTFGAQWGRIRMHLVDLTTGELRWDAVYDLGKTPFKRPWKPVKAFDFLSGSAKDTLTGVNPKNLIPDSLKKDFDPTEPKPGPCSPNTGRQLCPEELPIGGRHPFFVPDWCPMPGDGKAHRYRLTIDNLSPYNHPSQDVVGEMMFTQYGPAQLRNTYAHESASTL